MDFKGIACFLALFFIVGLVSGDSPDTTISVLVCGDLMLGHRAIPVIEKEGTDYPFDSLRCVTGAADIAIANLEAPFTREGRPYPKTYTFRVPPSFVGGVARAGFDLLTLANNHILDFGVEGLRATFRTLDSAGVARCGAGLDLAEAMRPTLFDHEWIRIGFLAFSFTFPDSFWATPHRPGTAHADIKTFKKAIRRLKDSTDIVIVSVHWGEESREEPKAYQIQYARGAVEAGADLIVGHHPHVLQGVEIYHERLIAYSLGNFVFGSYGQKVRDGAMLRARFTRRGLVEAEILPICVNNHRVRFSPRLYRNDQRRRVIRHLNTLSKGLNGGAEIIDESGIIRVSTGEVP